MAGFFGDWDASEDVGPPFRVSGVRLVLGVLVMLLVLVAVVWFSIQAMWPLNALAAQHERWFWGVRPWKDYDGWKHYAIGAFLFPVRFVPVEVPLGSGT